MSSSSSCTTLVCSLAQKPEVTHTRTINIASLRIRPVPSTHSFKQSRHSPLAFPPHSMLLSLRHGSKSTTGRRPIVSRVSIAIFSTRQPHIPASAWRRMVLLGPPSMTFGDCSLMSRCRDAPRCSLCFINQTTCIGQLTTLYQTRPGRRLHRSLC